MSKLSHITIRPRDQSERDLFTELGGARWFHAQLGTIAAVKEANRKEDQASGDARTALCFQTQVTGAEVKLSFVSAEHADAFVRLGLNGFVNMIVQRELSGNQS